jgi:NAD(P)H-quinone oxidoreductase subunit 5
MEAPTPVSALLHAGIVNIGGFVMIRLGGMMLRLDAAQTLLVAAGTVTAVLAALVMTTRVSVKVSLAWSTAAQMGFMLLECGLGAYGLALLHLMAHSLYKAHAFLSSGSTVEQQVMRSMLPARPAPGLGRWFGAAIAGALVVGAVGAALGLQPSDEPSLIPAGVILAIALAPLLARASLANGWRPAALALGTGAGLTAIYAGWHQLFAGIVPPQSIGSTGELARMGIVVTGFVILFTVQSIVSARPTGSLAKVLYPACYAGFYLDEIFTRLTFKIWPPQPAPAEPTPAIRRGARPLERAA